MVRVWRSWVGSRRTYSCVEVGWLRICGGKRRPRDKRFEDDEIIDEVISRWLKKKLGRSTGEVMVVEEEVLDMLKGMRDILMRHGLGRWEEVNDIIDVLSG